MELDIWHFWLIAAILFFIAEVFLPTFLMVSLGIGCLLSSFGAMVGGTMPIQLSLFILGTLGGFVAIRPLFRKYLYRESSVKTNVFGISGRIGKVTAEVDQKTGYAEVAIDGDRWRAETLNGDVLSVGDKVEIVRVDTTIVTVKLLNPTPLNVEGHLSSEGNEITPDRSKEAHYENHTHVAEKIMVSIGNKKILVDLEQILCLYSAEKISYLITLDGKQHIVDDSLEKVIERLPLGKFFRANRQYILSLKCIQKVMSSNNGKLDLELVHENHLPEHITVSRLKSAAFRRWMKNQC